MHGDCLGYFEQDPVLVFQRLAGRYGMPIHRRSV
jgi:hypothetical protein